MMNSVLTIPHNQTASNQDYAQSVTELPLMNCLTYVCWSTGQYGYIIDKKQIHCTVDFGEAIYLLSAKYILK